MNELVILLIAIAAAAGVLTATFTTIFTIVRRETERRNRELFDAYVRRPREVEAWLMRGALEHLQQRLAPDSSRQ